MLSSVLAVGVAVGAVQNAGPVILKFCTRSVEPSLIVVILAVALRVTQSPRCPAPLELGARPSA
jgi:uncharacterized integral membrane protein